jgi:hypothetical protein
MYKNNKQKHAFDARKNLLSVLIHNPQLFQTEQTFVSRTLNISLREELRRRPSALCECEVP